MAELYEVTLLIKIGNEFLHARARTMNKVRIDVCLADPSVSKKRTASSPPGNAAPAKRPVSRREELLKQLKAVEDAIARKRSKI